MLHDLGTPIDYSDKGLPPVLVFPEEHDFNQKMKNIAMNIDEEILKL